MLNLNEFIQYDTLKNVKRAQKQKSVEPTTSSIIVPSSNQELDTNINPVNPLETNIKPVQDTLTDINKCLNSLLTISKDWDKDIEITDLFIKSKEEYLLLKKHRQIIKSSMEKYFNNLISKMENDTIQIISNNQKVNSKKSFFSKK